MPFGQQCIKMVTVFGRLSCKWLKRFLWEESSHVHSFLPSFPSKPKTPSDAGGSVRKQQAPRAMPGAASILLSMAIIWGFWLWPRQNQAVCGFSMGEAILLQMGDGSLQSTFLYGGCLWGAQADTLQGGYRSAGAICAVPGRAGPLRPSLAASPPLNWANSLSTEAQCRALADQNIVICHLCFTLEYVSHSVLKIFRKNMFSSLYFCSKKLPSLLW